jgi:acetyl esterase
MPVDPQFSGILAMLKTVPPARVMPLELVRTQPFPEGPVTPVAKVEDTEFPSAAGPIAVRIYTPREASALPLLVFFHGGGFVVGGLNSHDEIARELAVAGDCIVVSVVYRLAPEHPFPAASDDSVAAVRWAVKHAGNIGADPSRVAVCGDSAGGNLAAVAALRLRDAGDPPLAAQLLIYPVTDLASPREGSMAETGEGFYITQDDMDFFFESYAGTNDPADPHISPLHAASLANLPPALVVTGECDPLRDQGQAYAERLANAGVATELAHYDGAIHGFLTFPGEMGREAVHHAGTWLKKMFAGQ